MALIFCSIIVSLVIYFKYQIFFLGIPWQPALLIAVFATVAEYFSPTSKLIITDDIIIQKKIFGQKSIKVVDDIEVKSIGFFHFSLSSSILRKKIILSCYNKKEIKNFISK